MRNKQVSQFSVAGFRWRLKSIGDWLRSLSPGFGQLPTYPGHKTRGGQESVATCPHPSTLKRDIACNQSAVYPPPAHSLCLQSSLAPAEEIKVPSSKTPTPSETLCFRDRVGQEITLPALANLLPVILPFWFNQHYFPPVLLKKKRGPYVGVLNGESDLYVSLVLLYGCENGPCQVTEKRLPGFRNQVSKKTFASPT